MQQSELFVIRVGDIWLSKSSAALMVGIRALRLGREQRPQRHRLGVRLRLQLRHQSGNSGGHYQDAGAKSFVSSKSLLQFIAWNSRDHSRLPCAPYQKCLSPAARPQNTVSPVPAHGPPASACPNTPAPRLLVAGRGPDRARSGTGGLSRLRVLVQRRDAGQAVIRVRVERIFSSVCSRTSRYFFLAASRFRAP
jgi:hypothetical protein